MKNELLARAYIVAIGLTLFALIVLAKTFQFSVSEADYWKQRGQQSKTRVLRAQRGNILAADTSYLVTTQYEYDIHFDPNSDGLSQEVFDQKVDSLAWYISKNLNSRKTPAQIAEKLRKLRENNNRYFSLVRKATPQQKRQIEKWPILRRGRIKGGFGVHTNNKRKRHYGKMARRTIGFNNERGKVGLEAYFDEILSGDTIEVAGHTNFSGVFEPLVDISALNLERGKDIQTTLEVTVQDHVQQVIEKAVAKHNAEYGVGIVMEVKTGAIRALTSLSMQNDGSISETLSQAVDARVEPGSTFKLASILALLENKSFKLNDSIRLYKGVKKWGKQTMRDASLHGLEKSTVQHAFEISSNVGIATMVTEGFGNDIAGRKAFVDKLRQYKLHDKTNIEVPEESSPWIKNPEKDTTSKYWSGNTLPWMSMGYEVELTPIQMTAFFNAVANNGTYVKPRLVENIQIDGKIIEEFKPLVLKNQISTQEAIQQSKKLLEGVVLRGTARNHISDEYAFAGKTGTVQYEYSNKGKKKYQSSFIGYFPADDPHYTIMVLISKPDKEYYASKVALPVWREIADNLYASDPNLKKPIIVKDLPEWQAHTLPHRGKGYYNDIKTAFRLLGIPAHNQAHQGFVNLELSNDSLLIKPHNIPEGRIPNVIGMGARDAMFLLEDLGCNVKLSGSGLVVKQSIRPGKKSEGQYIRLILG